MFGRSTIPGLSMLALACGCTVQPRLPANETSIAAVKPSAHAVYQPLATGRAWKYLCNHQFSIENRVVGTAQVDGRTVYEFSLQIPSSATRSVRVIQLLANDASGTTRIYGYLLHGKVRKVAPTAIVVPSPVLDAHYDYPGPRGSKIGRVFVGFENTNPTPLGTFWVAPYFESGATHNYGYALGRGIMEEDHGPNYEYDCLIEHVTQR